MKRGAAGAALLLPGRLVFSGSAFGATSVAGSLTPYVDPLPLLVDNALDGTGGGKLAISCRWCRARFIAIYP